MKKQGNWIVAALVLSALLTACGKNSPMAPTVAPTRGVISFALDAASASKANIVSGRTTITKGSLTESQTVKLDSQAASVTFKDVQVGTWTMKVSLWDKDGVEIYQGSGEAKVMTNQTTTVHVKAVQNTGNLKITVELPTIIAQGLVFWNTLGSAEEVLHSKVGPNLVKYVQNPGDLLAYQGTLVYVPGKFENGVRTSGSPAVDAHVHTLVINPNQVINSDQGAIECWYMQSSSPNVGSHGEHRLFDGFGGLENGGDPTIGLCVGDASEVSFTLSNPGIANSNYTISAPLNYTSLVNTWFHLACVWNRSGIAGTAETMQLYIDGVKVISATYGYKDWTSNFGDRADICGQNGALVGQFVMDNLKIWNYAKTDFSDRFSE